MATTIDWPVWLTPTEFTPTLKDASIVHRSPYNQVPDVYAEPGAHWVFSVLLAPCRPDDPDAARRGAFLRQISGGKARVRVPFWVHRTPWGTLRGAPTLSAAVAAGAASLPLQGATASPSLLVNGGFELDSNADGLADGCIVYTLGAPGTTTPDRQNVSGRGKVQRILADGYGSSTGQRLGVRLADVATVEAQTVTLAADVRITSGTPGSVGRVEMRFVDVGGVVLQTDVSADVVMSTGYQRLSITATAPASTVSVRSYAYIVPQASGAATTGGIMVDAAQVEPGAVATPFAGEPTLLAGDHVGVAGQRFEVAADVTLTGGSGEVTVNNRPHSPLSSGALVVWSSPLVTTVCVSNVPTTYRPGVMDAVPLELEEVWDA